MKDNQPRTLIEIYNEQKAKGILPPYDLQFSDFPEDKLLIFDEETRQAIVKVENRKLTVVESDVTYYSLPPRQKIKYAKYAYKETSIHRWSETEKFFKDDTEFLTVYPMKGLKFARLNHTEMELED